MSKQNKDNLSSEAKSKSQEIQDIIQSKRQQKESEEQAVEVIVEYVENKMCPLSLNKTGLKGIKQLCCKFSPSDIIEAVDISASKYLRYNSDDELIKESAEEFIQKIGGITNLQTRPLVDRKIAYVKGICRNRFDYFNEWRGTDILKDYVDALRFAGYGEEAIIRDFDEEVIPETKTARNWSQWRNLLEGWADDLRAMRSDHPPSNQNEDQDEPEYQAPEYKPQSNDNQYIEEKRRGGANSYQAYKPLRDKVEELCQSALNIRHFSSANQLCHVIASFIEEKNPELLEPFQPYQNSERDGSDWKRPTFYGWCNTHYKKHKANV